MPPKYVKLILSRLQAAGFEAYMAGGCVRDTLMGRSPADYDIATSAPPDEVRRLFGRTVPTGLRHGTVTVLYAGRACEVTTYRIDGSYDNCRRPHQVTFTGDILLDLARRDFTVNAMAMDLGGGIIDPFGGRGDIDRRLIRCVGEPRERFSEDALRMLRALRFAAKLGFAIDPPTLGAMRACAPLAAKLSAERVAAELSGILASPRPDTVWQAVDMGLMARFLRPGAGPRHALAPLPHYARLPRLCADLEAGGYIMSTESFLRGLRLPARVISSGSSAAEILLSGSRDYKRLLHSYGRGAVLAAYPKSRELRRILRSGECWSREQLKISGAELRAAGFEGAGIRDALEALLRHVMERPEDNEHEILCKLAKELKPNDRA